MPELVMLALRVRVIRVLFVCFAVVALAGRASAAADQPIYVMFTVDVESLTAGNPDKDIWVRDEDGDHGISRMMDILDRHGVKGTFFVNMYESAIHGDRQIADVCRAIDERGHDVQLHTHPSPMFGTYSMKEAPLDEQEEILRAGIEMIRQAIGKDVIAHRAGGYEANYDTLAACKHVGILSEYSHNYGYHGEGFTSPQLTVNRPVLHNGVLCVPVTNYVQASAGGWRSTRFLDIESSSPAEIRTVISELQAHGVRTAVIMMHSFSFKRTGGRGGERAEKVFDELLAELVANPEVKVVSARQLYDLWRADPAALEGKDHLPETGWWMTYCRAWQRLGEGWKNIVVAFAPPGAVAFTLSGGLILWRRHRRKRRATV